MATPQESITTVNGRRCTRSRARSAATSIFSSEPAVVTPTELTSSTTTTEQAQQVETSAADPPPQPPPSSSSQESSEQQQQAVVPSTQQAAASSAIGTQRVVPTSIAPQQATQLADTEPLFPPPPPPPPPPVEAQPAVLEDPAPAEATSIESVVSAAAEITTTTAPTITTPNTSAPPTSSNPPTETAVFSSRRVISSSAIPTLPTASPESSIQSSVPALPEQPAQSLIPTEPSPGDGQQSQPQPPESAQSELPTNGSAGIISPEEGGSLDDVGGLTIPGNAQASIGSIVGGVVGGFLGIALISALLFLCLRRRKSRGFKGWNEKAVRHSEWKDKLKAIPASFGMFFAKLKGKKSGPAENPYSRHTARSSISSVYSQGSNGHGRSVSEPPQHRSFAGRMLSIKKSKNLLHKKQDSLVVGAKSPFPGIVEDPVVRNSKGLEDPFADPEEPPRTLLLLNPDDNDDNRNTQQRPLTTPKPAAVPERASRDPFQSILDELDERNGSGTPEWLKDSGHKRTTSAATALQSHPPSTYTASVYTMNDPFRDSQAPPVPTQPLPPNPPKQPGNIYGAGFPAFNGTSTTVSRDSNYSFFGEPGPSRPATNMFNTSGRYGRQSDPFDLDRPEVLGFGSVTGRREVRASVTRQNSRSNRASSVPNWVSVEDGPYERASAVPVPLRKPSTKR